MLLVISEVTGVLAANTEVAVAAPSAVSSTPEGAPPVSPTRLLTPREREIMNLVLEGHTSRMIASILSVSLKTVEAHRSNVLRKLGVRNSTQLAAVVGRADV
jgi:DNA-binding NarL/FixJ family response regulator